MCMVFVYIFVTGLGTCFNRMVCGNGPTMFAPCVSQEAKLFIYLLPDVLLLIIWVQRSIVLNNQMLSDKRNVLIQFAATKPFLEKQKSRK